VSEEVVLLINGRDGIHASRDGTTPTPNLTCKRGYGGIR
jgi:hypothetical protein